MNDTETNNSTFQTQAHNLETCLTKLRNLNDPFYNSQPGIEQFSAALALLDTEQMYKFAAAWLRQLNEVQEIWDENQLIVFLYVASDSILRSLPFKQTTKLAFEKVLPDAFGIFQQTMFAQSRRVVRILDIWSERQVFNLEFLMNLRKIFLGKSGDLDKKSHRNGNRKSKEKTSKSKSVKLVADVTNKRIKAADDDDDEGDEDLAVINELNENDDFESEYDDLKEGYDEMESGNAVSGILRRQSSAVSGMTAASAMSETDTTANLLETLLHLEAKSKAIHKQSIINLTQKVDDNSGKENLDVDANDELQVMHAKFNEKEKFEEFVKMLETYEKRLETGINLNDVIDVDKELEEITKLEKEIGDAVAKLRTVREAKISQKLISDGLDVALTNKIGELESKMEKDVMRMSKMREVEKQINDLLEGKIETVEVRKGVITGTVRETIKVPKSRKKNPLELLIEKQKKQEEEEEKMRRKKEENIPRRYDKMLKKYVPDTQIGEIESWRER